MKKSLLLFLITLLGCVLQVEAGFLGGSTTYHYVGYIANGIPNPVKNSATIKVSIYDVEYNGNSYNIVQYQKPDGTLGSRVSISGLWYIMDSDFSDQYDCMVLTLTNGGITQLYVSDEDVAERLRSNVGNSSYGGGNSSYGGNYNGGSSNYSNHRTCPGCNGTGKGPDQITYATDYTGNSSVYCNTCGRTMARHSHHQPMCRTCYGKGYIE
ncbi:MAG: hypothetical protein NC111_03530 [Bacteroides sp.]|nr:hypothetical protein [Bacteroides sp.]MCM1412916.1 hypothetical protein [Bacteroides sp.]MCM1471585.1 hypothetical protein [Bacteroides sp.]